MSKNISTQELTDYDLTHCRAGNGLAMVEVIDRNYCRVTEIYKQHDKFSRGFLAARSELSVTERKAPDTGKMTPVKIPAELRPRLAEIRAQIGAGKARYVETHLVVK